MVERLGVSTAYKLSPENTDVELWTAPRPCVEIAPEVTPSVRVTGVQQEMQEALQRATFDCPILGPETNCVEYLSLAVPIVKTLEDYLGELQGPKRRRPNDSRYAILEQACARVARVADRKTRASAIYAVMNAVQVVASRHSRMDDAFFDVRLSVDRTQSDRFIIRVRLHVQAPEKCIDRAAGEPRTYFRCGQPDVGSGVQWLSWDRKILDSVGIRCDADSLPVYVTSHVLRRLSERLGVIETWDPFLQFCLWLSLAAPQVVQTDAVEESVLVSYLLNEHKLGYIPCSVRNGKVVAETFLFLTMDRTPEGELLRGKLRIGRADRTYLQLDRIDTFLQSDIKEDRQLVAILSECGCGHLFKITGEEAIADEMRGFADAMRKYLRLPAKIIEET